MRKYWEANPNSLKNKHLLPMHEALHIAVVLLFGGEPKYILIRTRTGQCDYRPNPLAPGWREAACRLAPALIDDMSEGDSESFGWIQPRRRGYAWGWLNKNRETIMLAANEIARHMGPGPGRLLPAETESGWTWVPKAPKRRKS